MSRVIRLTILSLVAVTVVSSSADAQRRRGLVDVSPENGRRGFWIEGAAGMGSESYTFGNEAYAPSLEKPTVALRLGGTVNPNLRLGGEVATWWHSYNDLDAHVTESLTHVMAIARFYPSREMGLFGKAGVGIGVTATSVEFGNTTSESGFGGVLGAGYEIQVSRKLFITPAVDYYASRYTQRNDDTLKERLWNFSLGVTFQPGR